MKKIKFYDEIYMVTYFVFIGGTAKEFEKVMVRHKVSLGDVTNDDKAFFRGVSLKKSTMCFIWCYAKDFPLIAHECLHAVTFVFKEIGMPIYKKADEAACYYQQFIMQKISDLT